MADMTGLHTPPKSHPVPADGSKTSGEFMHQKSKLKPVAKIPLLQRLASRELLPIMPLAGMVSLAIGLSGYMCYHHLAKAPDVFLSKKSRQEVPELERPHDTAGQAIHYKETNVLRRLGRNQEGAIGATKDFMLQPPKLPGDDTSPVGATRGNTEFGKAMPKYGGR